MTSVDPYSKLFKNFVKHPRVNNKESLRLECGLKEVMKKSRLQCFWMITFLEKDLYGRKIVISCVFQNLEECTEEWELIAKDIVRQ